MTNHDDPLADNPYDLDWEERHGSPMFTLAEQEEARWCFDCEEDMTEEDYQARLAAMFPEARRAGVRPVCDSCEEENRDAALENPYG